MKKVALLLVMILVLSAFMAGCTQNETGGGNEEGDGQQAGSNEIVIGVFEPLTGANAAGGELEKMGIDLANEMYPTVMVDGVEYTIKLEYADNKSDKLESANAARNLVDQRNATIVLGSWGSNNAMAGGPIFLETQTPAIGTSCTNPQVTLNNDYYFRVCFNDYFQGEVMANYAINELGLDKIAIIQEVNNDYSVALAKIFTDKVTEMTGNPDTITNTVNYSTGDQDFNAILTNIKEAGVKAVFAPGNFTESGLIFKQAQQLGMDDVLFLGADTWETPELIDIAGDAADGVVYSSFFDPLAPLSDMTTVFLDAYAEKYDGASPAGVTACGFDAYLLALYAIEQAGSLEGPDIQAVLSQVDGWEGATGVVTMDENGDPIKSAVIKTIENGDFVYKSTVHPF